MVSGRGDKSVRCQLLSVGLCFLFDCVVVVGLFVVVVLLGKQAILLANEFWRTCTGTST